MSLYLVMGPGEHVGSGVSSFIEQISVSSSWLELGMDAGDMTCEVVTVEADDEDMDVGVSKVGGGGALVEHGVSHEHDGGEGLVHSMLSSLGAIQDLSLFRGE